MVGRVGDRGRDEWGETRLVLGYVHGLGLVGGVFGLGLVLG